MVLKISAISRDRLAALALIFAEQLAYRRNRPVLRSADVVELICQGALRGLDLMQDSPRSEWHYKGILNHLYTVMRLRGVAPRSGVQNGHLVPSWSNFCSLTEGKVLLYFIFL